MHRAAKIIVLLGCLVLASLTQAESPIAIVVPKEYGRKWDLQIDGKNVAGSRVLDELIELKRSRGREIPVVVLLPNSARFEDWTNLQGIIEKVAFEKVRYFAFSSENQKMIEIKREGSAVPFSLTP